MNRYVLITTYMVLLFIHIFAYGKGTVDPIPTSFITLSSEVCSGEALVKIKYPQVFKGYTLTSISFSKGAEILFSFFGSSSLEDICMTPDFVSELQIDIVYGSSPDVIYRYLFYLNDINVLSQDDLAERPYDFMLSVSPGLGALGTL